MFFGIGFVFGFLGSANGQGAEASVEEFFHFAQEAVAAEGAASVGVGSQGVGFRFIVGGFEQLFPVVVREERFPGCQVQQVERVGLGDVGWGAGPGIVPGVFDQTGTDGVSLDVTDGSPEVVFIEGGGKKAILPEVAGSFVEAVDVSRVEVVGSADGAGQGVDSRGDGDQVDVVAHQAIAEDREAVEVALRFEQREVNLSILIDEKDVLPVIAPLGNMVGDIRDDDSCYAWHMRIIAEKWGFDQ